MNQVTSRNFEFCIPLPKLRAYYRDTMMNQHVTLIQLKHWECRGLFEMSSSQSGDQTGDQLGAHSGDYTTPCLRAHFSTLYDTASVISKPVVRPVNQCIMLPVATHTCDWMFSALVVPTAGETLNEEKLDVASKKRKQAAQSHVETPLVGKNKDNTMAASLLNGKSFLRACEFTSYLQKIAQAAWKMFHYVHSTNIDPSKKIRLQHE